MPGLAEIASFLSNLLDPSNSSGQGKPEAFYETRVTQTPGATDSKIDPQHSGGYDPQASPVEMVKNSSLPDDVKAQLLKAWEKKEKGFITTKPNAPSNTFKHEQLHNVFDKGGLGDRAKDISAKLDPTTRKIIDSDYQGEMKVYGRDNILADEGMAYDLGTAGGIGQRNQALVDYVSGLLGEKGKGKQKKQFERLTE